MARYFISYSRSDQAFALRFAQDLKTAGVDVWVDQLDIPIGQNSDRSVEAAVRDCEGFVIILSPRSAASEHVADEVACALEDHKHIIPIFIEKCTIPMRLARLQFIDATSDYDNALARFQLIIGAAPSSAAAIAPAASAASAVQTKPVAHWAPGLLVRAEQRLTEHVGPIARLLVSKAAGAAGNEAELYASLALAIPDAAERANFLRQFAGASDGNGPGAPFAKRRLANRPARSRKNCSTKQRGFDRASRPYGETCGDERKPRSENPRGSLSASPRAHSQREREGGIAEEAAIAAYRLACPCSTSLQMFCSR